LANRCPIGSAPLERLGDHDVSLFLCDLAYQSSRLEGNEYDFANTIALLDHRIDKDGGKKEDRIMILNHHDAVRFIIDNVPRQDASEDEKHAGINVRCNDLLSLHAILSADLMRNPAHCGALRKSNVEIGGSTYLPPDIPDRIREFFDRVTTKAARIEDPWEQAVFLNVHLPYVQPFEDCNKRVARVACNIPLLRAGVTPMSWTDVPRKDYTDAMIAVYELNDPLMLADIFTEGYLRSCERFELMSRTQDPDPLVMQYRYEIRQSIRQRILDDHDGVPSNVAPDKAADFIRYVELQLEALLANPLQAPRFGFRAEDVDAYAERNRFESAREREREA
jgi:fido (protein-threonine AMPylation protein)